jgi:8-oxo-dGTP pyrophosphatase MutT (NUDIX family)
MNEVAGVLIRQGDEFVLQHRDDIPTIAEPGMIGPWGGLIEPEDNTPEDAAARELLEETGVKTDKNNLIHLISYETTAKTPKNFGKPIVVHLYLLDLGTDETVHCFEGQEVFRAKTINDVPETKQSEFLKESIKVYESAR